MTATPSATPFEFVDDPASFPLPRAGGQRVVRIPSGVTRKDRLLNKIARGLDFPSYFGGNWDALDECLRDLSWLDGVTEVVLLHDAVPLSHPPTRATYLHLLRDLATQCAAEGPAIRVLFPTADRAAIQAMLDAE